MIIDFPMTQISSFQNPYALMYGKNEKLRQLSELYLFELMIIRAYSAHPDYHSNKIQNNQDFAFSVLNH